MEDTHKNMKLLFLYLGSAVALLIAVVSGFITTFIIIDHLLKPDSYSWFDFRNGVLGALPSSTAFFIISFGVLFTLSRLARLLAIDFRETTWHKVCRAVVMFILAVSLFAVLIAAALLLQDILSGEIALAYLLKLLFTAGVGAMTFYYYNGVLHGLWQSHKKRERLFVATVLILAGIIIVTGITIINPLQRSAVIETNATLERIHSMQTYIEGEFKTSGVLLEKYDMNFFYNRNSNAMPVNYEKTGLFTYRLCAEFRVPSQNIDLPNYPYTNYPVPSADTHCFDLSVQR